MIGASAGPRVQSASVIGAIGASVGKGVTGAADALGVLGIAGVDAVLRGMGTHAVGAGVGEETLGAQATSRSAAHTSHNARRTRECLHGPTLQASAGFITQVRPRRITSDCTLANGRARLVPLSPLPGRSILARGSGWVPVGSPVFKTGGGPFYGPRWVRPPSTPAFLF